jgi:hypothetical protein
MTDKSRVTRLGDFSPIGRFFTLGLKKISLHTTNKNGLLFRIKSNALIWREKMFWAIFFTKSSVHPGQE